MKWPKREVLVVVVGILILGLAGGSTLAQKKKEKLRVEKPIQRQERPQNVVSTNVLGLSQGVINLEYEKAGFYVAPELAFVGEVTLFAVSVGWKYYFSDTAPAGFWYGYFGAFAPAVIMGYLSYTAGWGVNVGYKHFIADRFTIEGRLGWINLMYGGSGLLYKVNVGYAF